MEEALRRMNIKYKVVGGVSFYQRKEIKDLLAYLRFVINQNDEQALRRIINLPKRGIGPTTVDKMVVAAFDHDMSLWEVIDNAESFLGWQNVKSHSRFCYHDSQFHDIGTKKGRVRSSLTHRQEFWATQGAVRRQDDRGSQPT